MPFSQEVRIKNILKLGDNKEENIIGKHKIDWKGETSWRDVYKIPISYLIYNKYNGRILSRIKSLEKQKKKLNTENEKDFNKIEKLLFDSHPSRNRQTEDSIMRKGQEKPGIITQDGVVIDGNRRLMFLNRIVDKQEKLDTEKFKYFEAVILPVTLINAPDEIRRLETTYQMGEDKKLDYNPIEKYLKAQELIKNKVDEKDIASWMGETKVEITKYLNTIKTMDKYLEFLEYDGIYTQLDGREDWFLSLTKWLGNLRGEGSNKAFDGYTDDDVDDLELICYDYIRAKHGGDGKRFRKIADGQQHNNIFGNKELWKTFRDLHFKQIQPIKDEESTIDYNAENLKSHLDSRDKKFTEKSDKYLTENLNNRISELFNKLNHDKPEKLINKADSALKEINIKARSFSESSVQTRLKEISNKVNELLLQNDVSLVLEQSLRLLKKIDIMTLSNENGDNKLSLIKEINQLSFNMKKQLGN